MSPCHLNRARTLGRVARPQPPVTVGPPAPCLLIDVEPARVEVAEDDGGEVDDTGDGRGTEPVRESAIAELTVGVVPPTVGRARAVQRADVKGTNRDRLEGDAPG